MSTYEPLPGVKPRPHVGIFVPSTELLERYRGILASSPPSSRKSSLADVSIAISRRRTHCLIPWQGRTINLPFQPEQRRANSTETSTKYISFAPPSKIERKETRAIKISSSRPRATVTRRSRSPCLPYLIHPNIVDPLDILQDESGEYAVTFTTMATLESIISHSRRLPTDEVDSYFKQATIGVYYLHNSGVAHQNLRPENFVLTINGVLKIANFDAAEIFGASHRDPQVKVRSRQRWSSAEYVAPEVFVESSFDPRPVDMWALGVVYMEMRTGKLLWSFAAEGADEFYDRYLMERSGMWGYRPIEN